MQKTNVINDYVTRLHNKITFHDEVINAQKHESYANSE